MNKASICTVLTQSINLYSIDASVQQLIGIGPVLGPSEFCLIGISTGTQSFWTDYIRSDIGPVPVQITLQDPNNRYRYFNRSTKIASVPVPVRCTDLKINRCTD